MKKIIALGIVVASVAATSAFGQGYFDFQSGKNIVFDGFTTAGSATETANVDVAFLWAASGTPSVDSLLASTPKTGNSTTTETYTVAQAWNAILNDPNFTLGVNSANSAVVVTTTVASPAGSFAYTPPAGTAGQTFGVTGTTVNTTYTIFAISWNSAFATPALAAAGGSAVGWSAPFTFLMQGAGNTPNAYSIGAFGTFAPPSAVPEPGTMALAGLGGLSLLAFRRKK